MSRSGSHAGWLAGVVFAASAFFFSVGLEGYSHRVHPLGLLGAQGVPGGLAFDIVGFVVPGLIAAWVCWRLRDRIDAHGWMARIGAWMALLSCLAFAAQGLLRLDPADLESTPSRLHGAVWMLWWLAFAPGAALLALGLRSGANMRGLVLICALAAVAVPMFAMGLSEWVPTAIAHRIAFGLWFAWLAWMGYAQSDETVPRLP